MTQITNYGNISLSGEQKLNFLENTRMKKNSQQQMNASQILISIASLVIVIAGMMAAKTILVPFLLSAFIAIVSAPTLFWMMNKGVPKWLSMTLVIFSVLVFGILVVSLVASSINDFSANIPAYEEKLQKQTQRLLQVLDQLGIGISAVDLTGVLNPGAVMKFFAFALSALGNALANTFLILMTAVFILLEASSFPKKLVIVMGGSRSGVDRLKHFVENVKQYMAIKTVVSFVTAVIITFTLLLIGVDYPILWGVVAFILNYVPNIGSLIAAVPVVLLTIIQLNLSSAVVVAGCYLVINLVMGSIVEPKYMGKGLGLSTLVVFLSLLFWGWVLGPVGMLLSVPLTITAKIALESREDTQWIATLLGPEK